MIRSFALSFAVGLGVGAVYALLHVKSPAPPVVALAGLLGMVIGEAVIMHVIAMPHNV